MRQIVYNPITSVVLPEKLGVISSRKTRSTQGWHFFLLSGWGFVNRNGFNHSEPSFKMFRCRIYCITSSLRTGPLSYIGLVLFFQYL